MGIDNQRSPIGHNKKVELELSANPNNLELINRLAILKMETRDPQGALELFKKSVEVQPTLQGLNNLGSFYLHEGEPSEDGWFRRPKKAIKLLEKAIQLNPITHIPYSLLGEAYLRNRQFDRAEAVLRQAIRIKSTVANQNNLGVALFEQEEYEEALKYYFNANQFQSTKNHAYGLVLNLGVCLSKISRCTEAEDIATGFLINNEQVDNRCQVWPFDVMIIFYFCGDYKRVVRLFPTSVGKYVISESDFGMYLHSLYCLQMEQQGDLFVSQTLENFQREVDDIRSDTDFDEHERNGRIDDIQGTIIQFETIYGSIRDGSYPGCKYTPHIETGCYLFGCMRHNIPYMV